MSETSVHDVRGITLVTGILGSQKKANETATTARNVIKGRFKKSNRTIIIAVLILLLLNVWRNKAEEIGSTPDEVSSASPQSNAVGSQKPEWYGKEMSLTLSQDEWSDPIRITGEKSIRWWGKNPDGNAFATEVRGINDSTWYEWDEFLVLKVDGKLPYQNAGWIRFKANEPNAVVTYMFGFPDEFS
jgi:hypothetical protein